MKKKPHGVQLLVRAVVRDPDGKVITDTGKRPARSFLIQFLEFIYGLGLGTGGVYATATDETEDYIYWFNTACNLWIQIDAAVNDASYGIVVGTGPTAETNTDFKLETQLTEGVGAGEITHGAQIVGAATVVGGNVDLVLKRAFTNGTGSTITVKEAGLYTQSSVVNIHCIIRDVLPASVDVPDKCSLTIIYTVRTTV